MIQIVFVFRAMEVEGGARVVAEARGVVAEARGVVAEACVVEFGDGAEWALLLTENSVDSV